MQQRDFVNRWMNDTGQGETWTWGLGRYAMATFTYRFNDLSRLSRSIPLKDSIMSV